MGKTEYLEILKKIVIQLEESGINWVLTGSLGLAMQGVPVEVHDIDIQTDEEGAYQFEKIFAQDVVKPVRYSEAERIRSHLGAFSINGIKVEVMGDVQKRLDDQSWEESVVLEDHRHWMEIGQVQVPLLNLEYEYLAYLRMGRKEKAEKIRSSMGK